MTLANALRICSAMVSLISATAAIGAQPATAEKSGAASAWKTVPMDSSNWRREPFSIKAEPKRTQKQPSRPYAQKQGPLVRQVGTLDLQGIMKIDNRYYALINGRTVKTGDRIGNNVIRGISRYQVQVESESGKETIDIYQGRIDRGKQ